MKVSDQKTFAQASPYASPHSLRTRLVLQLWEVVWQGACAWTPKPMCRWRLFVLRLFGATLHGTPFVHQRARIHMPWNLVMHDRACLGDGAVAYSQGRIEIHARATVAQEAYLCTGTHDFSEPSLPLLTAAVVIGEDAFIGTRAFLMPGVTVGARSIVGAMSVVTKDVPPHVTVAGNPAKVIRDTGVRCNPEESAR